EALPAPHERYEPMLVERKALLVTPRHERAERPIGEMKPRELAFAPPQGPERVEAALRLQVDRRAGHRAQVAQLRDGEVVACMHEQRGLRAGERFVQRAREFGGEVAELRREARLRAAAREEQPLAE